MSPALWLPVLWLVITGSRFVSQWINLGSGEASSSTEGSPIDAAFFLGLIVVGVGVLATRNVSLGELVSRNRWIALMIGYSLISILWSDFPDVAGKRWFKTLGHPIMALIVLTDPSPMAAVRTVLKRCAYVLIPVSVLFIKYYPEYGRGWDNWTGQGFNNGIQLNKNGLGYICMVFGVFFLWNLLIAKGSATQPRQWSEVFLSILMLSITLWLLSASDSKTSMVCLTAGAGILVFLGWKALNLRHVARYIIVTGLILAAIELTFGVYEEIVLMLGRNPTLTDRTEVWADALTLQPNPLLGAGFESFWLGDRLDKLWEKWWWQPNQAHNGYIETYLSLGWLGVAIMVGMLLSTFLKICRHLPEDFELARLRLAFFSAILVFNYTEASFKGVHLVWTLFYLVALDCPIQRQPDKSRSASASSAKRSQITAASN